MLRYRIGVNLEVDVDSPAWTPTRVNRHELDNPIGVRYQSLQLLLL
ncbi:MAG: hypothetical protein LDL41_11105 [Coleofasciculus sp. S288]|nr:hypothetical protein [Coleofasciculus sp. S288]